MADSRDMQPGDSAPRRRLLSAAALTVLAAAPLRSPRAGEAAADRLRRWPSDRDTPALALPGWQGPTRSLADVRGRVVLLNFWASWCEPCLAEMPSLELLAARHAAQGLAVWAVNHRETDGAIDRFMARSGFTLPVLRDRDGAAARAFGVRIFPTTVAVGRDGRVAFSIVGETDWTGPDARQWVSALL